MQRYAPGPHYARVPCVWANTYGSDSTRTALTCKTNLSILLTGATRRSNYRCGGFCRAPDPKPRIPWERRRAEGWKKGPGTVDEEHRLNPAAVNRHQEEYSTEFACTSLWRTIAYLLDIY